MRINVRGLVQGVGFRPYVYRTASDLSLSGYVRNGPGGVEVEAEGPRERLDVLLTRLLSAPRPAKVTAVDHEAILPTEESGFRVLANVQQDDLRGSHATLIPLDRAPCRECLSDLMNPTDRRHLYPFITCSTCGPRFTILRSLPFDRAHTAMAPFAPCYDCWREYSDPTDRRFHAETISCPKCGPSLSLKNGVEETLATGVTALNEMIRRLQAGAIVALKGVGGYQLVADATSDKALARLREGKSRPGKPFALLFPSLSAVAETCNLDAGESDALTSPEKPIVLLRRKQTQGLRDENRAISSLVAPFSPYWGVMLPASPLHHVLMTLMGRPLVATSGNRRGEPICMDEKAAFAELRGLADAWLVHDREILHRADDSVVRVCRNLPRVMRLGRGYAPLALAHRQSGASHVLAVGGQEKNAFAVTTPRHIVLSQHVGDLTSPEALSMLASESLEFGALLHCRPAVVAVDRHPDYLASGIASPDLPSFSVQHHHAHALSCIAEHDLDGPVLAFAWDGTGYGDDRTLWGGEILRVEGTRVSRLGSLRPFSLPGGERAIREPRRSALGLLFEMYGDRTFEASRRTREAFTADEQRLLLSAIRQGINAPRTSSVGRLFDAAASLVGICQTALYSEQAPVALENVATASTTTRFYELAIDRQSDRGYSLDWEPLVSAMLEDLASEGDIGAVARGFHEALANSIATVAATEVNLHQVVLTGGVFQNALLTSLTEERLNARGLKVYTHALVPAGDGGLAVGQALYGLLASRVKEVASCV